MNKVLSLSCSLLVASLLSSCGESVLPPEEEEQTVEPIRVTTSKIYQSASEDENSIENKVSDVALYLFKGDELVQVINELDPGQSTFVLEAEKSDADNHVYLLANAQHLPEVKGLASGTIKRKDFLKLQIKEQSDMVPTEMILSGGGKISSGEIALKVNRGMARLDVVVNDPQLLVTKITANNTQATQYLFKQDEVMPLELKNMEFQPVKPINTSVKGVGYLNEQHENKKLFLDVEYIYKGKTENLRIPMPSDIDRNMAYEAVLARAADPAPDTPVEPGPPVVGYINVVEWDYAEDNTATPDLKAKIKVDILKSTFSDNTEFDPVANHWHVWHGGGQAQVALTGKYHKRIEIIEVDNRLTVSSVDEPYRASNIYIVANQIEQGAAYRVKLKVYKEFIDHDQGIEITIDIDQAIIPAVQMHNLEWRPIIMPSVHR